MEDADVCFRIPNVRLEEAQWRDRRAGVGSLPAGKYTQVRLNVSSAAIYFDAPSVGGPCAPAIPAPAGTSAPVDIPSGEVKLNNEFTVSGTGTTMVLDFDGDQSIRQTGSGNGNGNGNGNKNAKYRCPRLFGSSACSST